MGITEPVAAISAMKFQHLTLEFHGNAAEGISSVLRLLLRGRSISILRSCLRAGVSADGAADRTADDCCDYDGPTPASALIDFITRDSAVHTSSPLASLIRL